MAQIQLLDMWAEWCIDPKTNILLSNGLSVKADRLSVGSEVLSASDGKKTAGIVEYSKVVSDAGHCKLIETVSGRKIKVTDDHLFLTPSGWKTAEMLQKADKVAILPTEDNIRFKAGHKLLVSEEDIKKSASGSMRIKDYINELRDLGLLPLYTDNPKILIIARLMGALFSDGNLYQDIKNNYREISFALGQIEDVKEVIRDLNTLGYKRVHLSQKENEGIISGRKFINRGFGIKCLSTSLWLLFKTLGVPIGNKTDQAYLLPAWLMKASKAVKKEFLAAFLGGDGPKVTIYLQQRKNKNPYNHLMINDLEFHKKTELTKNGMRLAKQLKLLFEEFGVKIRKIFNEEENYLRKDGSRSTIIHICFGPDFVTGFNISHKIGYRYSRQKQISAMYVGEFLREIIELRNRWRGVYKQVKNLAAKGLGYRRVSKALGIKPLLAYNWIKDKDYPTTPQHKLKFPSWLEEAKFGLDDGLLWTKVKDINSVYLPEVSRITVEHTHNFIANGFVVHNCGPCRIMNPIIEEIEKELAGKVEVVKINVDEKPQEASKYGVMSIPTYIILKDGKEIGRKIGVTAKTELLKLLQS